MTTNDLAYLNRMGIVLEPTAGTERPLLYAYVDETGDRGWGGSSSEAFALCAAVFEADVVPDLESGLRDLKREVGAPLGAPIHWAEHVKPHAKRKLVARHLAQLPVDAVTVAVHKPCQAPGASGLRQPDRLYNYTLRLVLERLTWLARAKGANIRVVCEHVRGLSYPGLTSYLTHHLRPGPRVSIEWDHLAGVYCLGSHAGDPGLQYADLLAGCVGAALRTDHFGDYEEKYVATIRDRFWAGPTDRVDSYGMKFLGTCQPSCLERYPWWEALRAA